MISIRNACPDISQGMPRS